MASKPRKRKKMGNRARTKVNGVRSVRTPENRKKILEFITSGKAFTFTEAVTMCKLGITTGWEWKRADEAFAKEVEDALVGANTDILEKVALNHAVHGVPKVLTFQGQIQYEMEGLYPKLDEHGKKIPVTVTEYDHTLLTKMIERRRPKPIEINQTGNVAPSVVILPSNGREVNDKA